MQTITAKELAAKLNNREYGNEITKEEELLAKNSNLLVVFGASDDLVEVRGKFDDENGCYNGGTIHIHPRKGLLQDHDNCECGYCNYETYKNRSFKIDIFWDTEGYSWTYKTDAEHECFDILDNGEKYCRGIVVDLLGDLD